MVEAEHLIAGLLVAVAGLSALAYQQMVQLVLGAQREALLRMRSEGKLSNEVMNRILRELDLEESRLEI